MADERRSGRAHVAEAVADPAAEPLAQKRKAGSSSTLLLLSVLTGVLLFPVALGSSQMIFNDGDVSWHIATGQWILQHHAIPRTDPFSFTWAGKPWVPIEWLAEVIYASAYSFAGYSGVSGVVTAALIALNGIVFFNALRWSRRVSSPLVTLVALDLVLIPMMLARPHLLAWPIMAGWIWLMLWARERNRAPPIWAALVMTLWANLHGSFVFGLALIGPFALEALLADRGQAFRTIRDWGLFGLASVAASLITPNGLEGFLHPFAIMGMGSLQEIGEWRSADFSQLGLFEIVLLEALFFCLWLGVRIPPLRLLLLLALLHMALQHTRHQPVFLVLAALLSARELATAIAAAFPARETKPAPSLPPRYAAAAVLAMLCLVVGLRLGFQVERRDDPLSPMRALAAVPVGLRAQPVYNDYLFGGYLIFAGVKPYIDGRADMYGDAFLLNYTSMKNSSPQRVQAELDRRGAQWTILQSTSRVAAMLDRSPQWMRIWSDRIAIVHVRRAALLQPQ